MSILDMVTPGSTNGTSADVSGLIAAAAAGAVGADGAEYTPEDSSPGSSDTESPPNEPQEHLLRTVTEPDVSLDEMLSLACRQGKLDIVQLLLQSGAHVNHRNKAGNTPLLEACSQGHVDVANYLLENGSNIDAPTETTMDSALTWACTLGNTSIVDALLAKKANVEHRTKDGCTALMFACLAGHKEVAEKLLDGNSEINVESDSNKDSPLTFACWKGHGDVVDLLLERRANIEHRTKEGFSPLMFAALGGHTTVARKLLNRNAQVNQPSGSNNDIPLTSACWKGHHNVVELLLEYTSSIEHRTKDGCTPLMLAAREGHLQVAALLLIHNAEVNVPSGSENNIPLTLACWKGHCNVVRLLLDHNSDIEHRNKAGCTPLMLASREGHLETTKLLLEREAEVNVPSGSNDDTPLTLACWKGHREVVILLLEYKSNIDHQTKTGCTPLMEATREGHKAVADILLNHNADVELPDNYGQSPLFMACWKGHRCVAELLLQRGAHRDCRTKTGITPLFQACRENHVSIVELLLDHGASVNTPFPNSRENPMTLSAEKGHKQLIELLLGRGATHDCHTKKGCTPAFLSCKEGHVDIAHRLFDEGANMELSDCRGTTPIMAAFKNGHTLIVEWLVNNVHHLPSDELCHKILMSSVDEKEKEVMLQRRSKCLAVIQEVKKKREQLALKNAQNLVKELDDERDREESKKKKQAAKRRDKRNKRKKNRGEAETAGNADTGGVSETGDASLTGMTGADTVTEDDDTAGDGIDDAVTQDGSDEAIEEDDDDNDDDELQRLLMPQENREGTEDPVDVSMATDLSITEDELFKLLQTPAALHGEMSLRCGIGGGDPEETAATQPKLIEKSSQGKRRVRRSAKSRGEKSSRIPNDERLAHNSIVERVEGMIDRELAEQLTGGVGDTLKSRNKNGTKQDLLLTSNIMLSPKIRDQLLPVDAPRPSTIDLSSTMDTSGGGGTKKQPRGKSSGGGSTTKYPASAYANKSGKPANPGDVVGGVGNPPGGGGNPPKKPAELELKESPSEAIHVLAKRLSDTSIGSTSSKMDEYSPQRESPKTSGISTPSTSTSGSSRAPAHWKLNGGGGGAAVPSSKVASTTHHTSRSRKKKPKATTANTAAVPPVTSIATTTAGTYITTLSDPRTEGTNLSPTYTEDWLEDSVVSKISFTDDWSEDVPDKFDEQPAIGGKSATAVPVANLSETEEFRESGWLYTVRTSKTVQLEMIVPNGFCGRVIGKGGKKINLITEESGAQITVEKPATNIYVASKRLIRIRGTPISAEKARNMVTKALNTPSFSKGEESESITTTAAQPVEPPSGRSTRSRRGKGGAAKSESVPPVPSTVPAPAAPPTPSIPHGLLPYSKVATGEFSMEDVQKHLLQQQQASLPSPPQPTGTVSSPMHFTTASGSPPQPITTSVPNTGCDAQLGEDQASLLDDSTLERSVFEDVEGVDESPQKHEMAATSDTEVTTTTDVAQPLCVTPPHAATPTQVSPQRSMHVQPPPSAVVTATALSAVLEPENNFSYFSPWPHNSPDVKRLPKQVTSSGSISNIELENSTSSRSYSWQVNSSVLSEPDRSRSISWTDEPTSLLEGSDSSTSEPPTNRSIPLGGVTAAVTGDGDPLVAVVSPWNTIHAPPSRPGNFDGGTAEPFFSTAAASAIGSGKPVDTAGMQLPSSEAQPIGSSDSWEAGSSASSVSSSKVELSSILDGTEETIAATGGGSQQTETAAAGGGLQPAWQQPQQQQLAVAPFPDKDTSRGASGSAGWAGHLRGAFSAPSSPAMQRSESHQQDQTLSQSLSQTNTAATSLNELNAAKKSVQKSSKEQSYQQASVPSSSSATPRSDNRRGSDSTTQWKVHSTAPSATVIGQPRKPPVSTTTTVTATATSVPSTGKQPTATSTAQWTVDRFQDVTSVGDLLFHLSLEKYTAKFEEQGITLEALTNFNESNLQSIGIPKGPRLKILKACQVIGYQPGGQLPSSLSASAEAFISSGGLPPPAGIHHQNQPIKDVPPPPPQPPQTHLHQQPQQQQQPQSLYHHHRYQPPMPSVAPVQPRTAQPPPPPPQQQLHNSGPIPFSELHHLRHDFSMPQHQNQFNQSAGGFNLMSMSHDLSQQQQQQQQQPRQDMYQGHSRAPAFTTSTGGGDFHHANATAAGNDFLSGTEFPRHIPLPPSMGVFSATPPNFPIGTKQQQQQQQIQAPPALPVPQQMMFPENQQQAYYFYPQS